MLNRTDTALEAVGGHPAAKRVGESLTVECSVLSNATPGKETDFVSAFCSAVAFLLVTKQSVNREPIYGHEAGSLRLVGVELQSDVPLSGSPITEPNDAMVETYVLKLERADPLWQPKDEADATRVSVFCWDNWVRRHALPEGFTAELNRRRAAYEKKQGAIDVPRAAESLSGAMREMDRARGHC